jgi:hypothetical protein
MGYQQAADVTLFAYLETVLLALNPPIKGFGNLTPGNIKMKPRSWWAMGTNPNNNVEPVRIETQTMTQFNAISQNLAAHMLSNLNVTDATVASDAHVNNYSGTPQGVESQRLDKTITINQFQKRLEVFFADWANHAIRSYLNANSGEIWMTVDEETRRKIWDIEMGEAKLAEQTMKAPAPSIIEGDKIKVDFDALSVDRLSFEVRTGSLIEDMKDVERRALQEMLIPVSQMMGNVSEQNREAFEQSIMQMMQRLCELSDIDIPIQLSSNFSDSMEKQALMATMQQVMQQDQQIQQLAAQQAMAQPQLSGAPEQALPEQVPTNAPDVPLQPSEAPTEGFNPQPPTEVSAEFPQQVVEANQI